MAAGDYEELKRLRRAAPRGEPDRAWRETILMIHLFAGVPRAIEAFEVLARVGGVGELEPGEAMAEGDVPARGDALFDRIYGARSAALRAHLEGFHPDFAAWIRGHAYGRVLSRPGLSLAIRELVAVAVLATLGLERQLASHARGAVRCGVDPADVHEVLSTLIPGIDPHRVERARHVVTRFARPEPDVAVPAPASSGR